MKEVLITPHIAFYADDSMKTMYSEAIASIHKFLTHKKLIHEIKEIED
jgi:lactate dehydrogenase-like 2-hydroxyacid dehydrogenase